MIEDEKLEMLDDAVEEFLAPPPVVVKKRRSYRPALLVVLGVVAVAIAARAVLRNEPADDSSAPAPTPTAASAGASTAASSKPASIGPASTKEASRSEASPNEVVVTKGAVKNEPLAPLTEGTPPAADVAPIRTPPSFDVVRINLKGDAVIAGRALPGAEVRILDGDQFVGSVTADSRGEWVFLPTKRLPPGARNLTLSSRFSGMDPIASEGSVVLVVPEPGKDIAGRALKGEGEGPPQSQALALRVPGQGVGSVVLQAPQTGPRARIGVDSVDHDEIGNLSVSGHATPLARVQIYLDNKPLGSVRASRDGTWILAPGIAVLAGRHPVRVDEIGADGKVASRAEVPFEPAPRDPASRQGANGPKVLVEAGTNLWRIARRTYGDGLNYTIIYAANRDRIKDPNLIYPGQILALPEPQQVKTAGPVHR